ncbi:MAG: hypothetical protein VYE50_03960 [Candidatus Thermoplasmatota archaeon]|nr:hypothetical protein [Candidatus Thermoplasmatota archaeon]
MGIFGRKKEEKKKFDYSDDTKEMFAERDAFYAEMRQKMGGNASNPELADQQKTEETKSQTDNLDDILGGSGGFDPYVDKEQAGTSPSQGTPVSSPQSSSSPEFVCTSCSKTFTEKWGKCPSCGGTMKSAASPAPSQPTSGPSPAQPVADTSVGDPLDDLLGDFGTSESSNSSSNEAPSDGDSGIKMTDDDLSTDFGQTSSSPSNRKRVRKVKKVKRPRKLP